jgi:hypothetical protein
MKVGEVAYKLSLPTNAKIHLVYLIQPEPVAVLEKRFRAQENNAITEVLIRWVGQSVKDATWEEFQALKKAYPHLVGKVF